MTDFIFRADYFQAVAQCISSDETRYYLQGVYIEPHPSGTGVLMVATNGHIMAVIHDPEGHADKPAILTTNFKSADFKSKRNESAPRVIHLTGDTGEIKCNGERVGVMPIEKIDGTFPAWRRVLPTDNSKEYAWNECCYSFAYLGRLQAAFKILGAKETKLDILPDKQLGAAIVHHGTDIDALFIIMPVRAPSVTYEKPEWLATP